MSDFIVNDLYRYPAKKRDRNALAGMRDGIRLGANISLPEYRLDQKFV